VCNGSLRKNIMPLTKYSRWFAALCALSLVFCASHAFAQAGKGETAKPVLRDGQHDFDWEIGTWKTHVKRRLHPLSGSQEWAEYDGTSVISKIWAGRANLVELEAEGPAGHLELLSLRLYNSQAHQWSLNVASSKGGSLGTPTIGEFKDGRGEFIDQESFNDRAILVRFVISKVTPNEYRFEQAFSDDGGKTWEMNWVATDVRQ